MASCKQITRNMSKFMFVRHVKAIYNRKSLPTSFTLPTTLRHWLFVESIFKSAKFQPSTLQSDFHLSAQYFQGKWNNKKDCKSARFPTSFMTFVNIEVQWGSKQELKVSNSLEKKYLPLIIVFRQQRRWLPNHCTDEILTAAGVLYSKCGSEWSHRDTYLSNITPTTNPGV